MPTSPPSLCTNQCGTLVFGGGQCPDCLAETRRVTDRRRGNGYQRGYTRTWAAFSKAYLDEHPFCECDECALRPQWLRDMATDVDHTGGHSRTCAHAYDEANLAALSHEAHARKTATEDGGFGHNGRQPRCDDLARDAYPQGDENL